MTEHEAKNHLNKHVAIKADGIACGYKYVKFIDYDASKTTIWGKGRITYVYKHPGDKAKKVHACFTQVQLYEENGQIMTKRKRNRNV